MDLSPIRAIPILDVAERLGIDVRRLNAHCFDGHDRRTASLHFYPLENRWHCYGCGKKGDAIELVMQKESISFLEAIKWFSHHFFIKQSSIALKSKSQNYNVKQAKLPHSKVQEFYPDPDVYSDLLSKCSSISLRLGVGYAKSHAISLAVAEQLGIRELSDQRHVFKQLLERWGGPRLHRSGLTRSNDKGEPQGLQWNGYGLIFPCWDGDMVVNMQVRLLMGVQRFFSPRGIRKPLYNKDRLGTLKPGDRIHICEGAPDAVSLESNGLAAVAVFGADSFRDEWVDAFTGFDVFVIGDGDNAGRRFMNTVHQSFEKKGKRIRCLRVPEGKDVSDVLAERRGQ